MNRPIPAIAALLLGLAMALPGQAQSQRNDGVLKGDAACMRCHGAGGESPVLAIGQTRHGTVADGRTPTCTSCHGLSDTHVNRPPQSRVRPKPERTFGKASGTPVEARNEACLACHQDGSRIHW